MAKYIVGMDGGGTKTAITIANLTGEVLKTFNAGAINYNGQDQESIDNSFSEIFSTINEHESIENCVSMCIGAAGISNPMVKQLLENQVKRNGYTGKLVITGDHEIALYGATGENYGIILIAGTGSICYGKNQIGESHRTGGFGYLIDDEGSGYAIGRDILSAVVQAHDGRIENTVMTNMVFEHLKINSVSDIVKFVYDKNTNKKDIAALSIILPIACSQNDIAAITIANKCADELFKLVIPVVKNLDLCNGKLALAGSILNKDKFIQTKFKENVKSIYSNIKCIEPKYAASYGAVIMAQQ